MSAARRTRLGQHFLEPAWVRKVVDAIEPDPSDVFVEIGAGRGALTLALAPACRRLVAIEIDPPLAAALAARVPANVSVVPGDVLDMELGALVQAEGASFAADAFRVAGNLPYQISSPVIMGLVGFSRSGTLRLRDATLMLQEEVVERLVAGPGSRARSVLGVLVQLRADVRRLLSLPPGAFRPMPRVRSALVRLAFRAPAVPLEDEANFEKMVRSMFMQRRKTLLNALAPYASTRRLAAAEALARAGLEPARRAETLSLAELARLSDVFAAPAAML